MILYYSGVNLLKFLPMKGKTVTLVEAPNGQLYTHWVRNFAFGSSAGYTRITSEDNLNGYAGEVIVLNGGSLDASIRHMVLRLEVASLIRVTQVQV